MSQSPPKPQRSGTGESIAGVPKRTIKWFAFKPKALRWLWYPAFRTYRVPQYLHDKINKLSKSDTRPRLRQFHNALSNNSDTGKVLERCVWVSTANGRPCTCNKQYSIAQNLDTFQRELSQTADRTFSLCGISIDAGNDFEPFVPWYVSMHISPIEHFRVLLRSIVQDHWPGQDLAITALVQEVKNRSPSRLAWKLMLPSEADSANIVDNPEPSLRRFDITLEWLRACPTFETFLGSHDWSIYISEPYTQRPQLDVLRLKDITTETSSNRRVVLITTSGDTLAHLKGQHDSAAEANVVSHLQSAEGQMLDSFLACLSTVVAEVRTYVEDSMRLLHELDMTSRSNPSSSKVQLLLHLHECHDWAAEACRKNLQTVSGLFMSLSPATEVTQYVYQRSRSSRRYTNDLEYLASEIDKQISQIETLRHGIIDQIELFDKRRNRTIGMFIAIYVPLAFATSFFGMNIKDSSKRTVSWTNTTSMNLSVPANDIYPWYINQYSWPTYRNNTILNGTSISRGYFEWLADPVTSDTPILISKTRLISDSPGNYNWPMWMFGVVAGALTFGSIILPLIGGRVYRSIARFSLRRRRTFRTVVSLLWILLLIVSIDGVWWFTFEEEQIWYDREAPYIMLFGDGGTNGPPLSTSVCIVGILLGLNAVRLNYAHGRQGQAIAWAVWILICGIDTFLINYDVLDVWYYEEPNPVKRAEWYVGGSMRLIWLWILLNWTFSRKGYSWSIYPAAPVGS